MGTEDQGGPLRSFIQHSHLKTRRPYLGFPETSMCGTQDWGRVWRGDWQAWFPIPFIFNFPAPSLSLILGLIYGGEAGMSLPPPSISGLEELLRPGSSSPWGEGADGRVGSKAGPHRPPV